MRPIRTLGAAAVLLLSTGACSQDEESEADVKEELADALERNGSVGAEAAKCFADIVIDELGIERVRDVDLSADEPEGDLAELTVEATQRANEECDLPEAEG